VLRAALVHADPPRSPAGAPADRPLPQVTVEADRAVLAHRISTFVFDITRAAPRGPWHAGGVSPVLRYAAPGAHLVQP
jgi:hypothetical protein